METQCSQQAFEFQPLSARQVTAGFDGGTITSDAGGLLLREVEAKTGLLADLARCFDDFRDEELIEHSVADLIKQRVFALALGYEDLNDHDQLRADPLLATLVGKRDVIGQERTDPRDRGQPLAGKSTLNRLELTPARANEKSRYKKIVARQKDIAAWFVKAFLRLNPEPLEEIILDLDATDDPIHGEQAGRFFHGYYKNYCYLPLYIFCGEPRRAGAAGEAAAVEHRRRGGERQASGLDHRADSPAVAPRADHPSRRRRLLSRQHHGLVRE